MKYKYENVGYEKESKYFIEQISRSIQTQFMLIKI